MVLKSFEYEIIKSMKEREKVSGIIQVYSKQARDQIATIGLDFLQKADIVDYADDIFACVDELIKNAVKSNYKFLLIWNQMLERSKLENPDKNNGELKTYVQDIIKDKDNFDRLAAEIIEAHKISATVREILNQESMQLSIKNRAYDEKRELSNDEKDRISDLKELQKIRQDMKEQDIKILINFESDGNHIYIEITNTAPIMSKDLDRIYDKRDEYLQYRLAGKEHEFFINNIDTSESGFGLGYAKIDSFLANMGLDTVSSVTIASTNNTMVLLTFPLNLLKNKK